jgi:hypothetical protein
MTFHTYLLLKRRQQNLAIYISMYYSGQKVICAASMARACVAFIDYCICLWDLLGTNIWEHDDHSVLPWEFVNLWYNHHSKSFPMMMMLNIPEWGFSILLIRTEYGSWAKQLVLTVHLPYTQHTLGGAIWRFSCFSICQCRCKCLGLIEKGLITLPNKIFFIFYWIIKNIFIQTQYWYIGLNIKKFFHLIVQKCLPNITLYLYYFANTPSYDIWHVLRLLWS